MRDEEGMPDLPRIIGRKWLEGLGGRLWKVAEADYEIIRRKGRKFLCRRRPIARGVEHDQVWCWHAGALGYWLCHLSNGQDITNHAFDVAG